MLKCIYFEAHSWKWLYLKCTPLPG